MTLANDNPTIMQAPLPRIADAAPAPSVHEQALAAAMQDINALKAKLFDAGQQYQQQGQQLQHQLEANALYQKVLNHIALHLRLAAGTPFSQLPELVEALVKERDAQVKADEQKATVAHFAQINADEQGKIIATHLAQPTVNLSSIEVKPSYEERAAHALERIADRLDAAIMHDDSNDYSLAESLGVIARNIDLCIDSEGKLRVDTR